MTKQADFTPGKRLFLKVLGGGLFGSAVAASPASAATRAAAWTHGQSIVIADPRRMQVESAPGAAKRMRGVSFSANRLLSVMSLPLAVEGAPPRVTAVLLRCRTMAGARLEDFAVHDGEREAVSAPLPALPVGEWFERRFELPEPVAITSAATVSIGVRFAATDREIDIGAVGCEVLI